MMKTNLSALCLLVAHSAFAAGGAAIHCSNAEETSVKIIRVSSSPELYRADVTAQSFGDSYPTFHFKGVKLLPQTHSTTHVSSSYEGNGFELTIHFDDIQHTRVATLNAPSIGIENDSSLTCK